MKKIYLDYAAATPLDPEVKRAMDETAGIFANPSANYSLGRQADEILQKARKQIAMPIGANTDEIIFTSGATESNNLAIFGLARANKSLGNHLLTISTEHPSILACFSQLEKEGFKTSICPVRSDGSLDIKKFEKLINDKTILVSISLANSEIGSVMQLPKIAQIIRSKNHKIFLHSDASAAVNSMKINVDRLKIDTLTLSGKKIYGPACGVLYVRRGVAIESIIFGGNQNYGLRAGTEDISLAIGMSTAIEKAQNSYKKFASETKKLKNYFSVKLKEIYPEAIINGSIDKALSNVINISFAGLDGEDLMYRLDQRGIIVGTGAACMASGDKPSYILLALGKTNEQAQGSLRISFGKNSSKKDIDQFFLSLKEILRDLK